MNGETIGYTKDGMVFMLVDATLDGKTYQTMMIWEPNKARMISQKLEDSAKGAEMEARGKMQ